MKPISSVLILIVAASLTLAINPEEKKAQMMKIVGECKGSTGASDDDVGKLMMHAKPSTHEGKCLMSCIMDNIGIVSMGCDG